MDVKQNKIDSAGIEEFDAGISVIRSQGIITEFFDDVRCQCKGYRIVINDKQGYTCIGGGCRFFHCIGAS